ncbi:DUF4440 domain-containing protein [Bacteroides sp. 51]|nr:DUF4440 domain-containing protein [Bacteroides sp. 51]
MFGQNKNTPNDALANKIIGMEKAALEEWNKGNPDGFLQIYAQDYTYFDPYLKKRVDGFNAIKELYDGIKGQVSADKYEMVDPVVQLTENIAVLTFNLYSYSGEKLYQWNCTEVYKLQPNKEWKIIHTHWSYIRPMDMK